MPPTPHITDAALGDGRIKAGPRANPTREYVSGGRYQWTTQYIRALPFWVDDATRDFGDDLYERMMLDPEVSRCVNLLKGSVIADGLQINPAVKEGEERHQQALEIADFCRRNIENLVRPFVTETLWDLLDAVAFGNKVAEQIYEVRKGGPDAGKLCLKALKVKPRRTVAFVVDVYQNVIGLLGLIPGQGYPLLVQTAMSNTDKIPNFLPRRKFAILSFRVRNGDPRGMSCCRPAYNPWWVKMQTWPGYLAYLAQFANPSLIGFTGEKADASVVTDAEGNVVIDETTGEPITISPEQVMVDSLVGLKNGTAIAFPFDYKVEPLEMQGNGDAFIAAFKLCDQQISAAILGQTLATQEGEHQARAASQVHQDILGVVVGLAKRCAEEMIRGDILKPLVEYNFGPEALDLVPVASLSKSDNANFAADATAIAALTKAGYIDPSQYRDVDARLGLPRRSDESIERDTERRNNPPADPTADGDGGHEPDPADEKDDEQ